MTTFGHKLRELRLERKVGMKRLARDLGISHTYISHIERGKAQPSESLIHKFSNYFNVEEESLLLAAGRFPHDIERILSEHPLEVVTILRSSFKEDKKEKHETKP